MKQRTLAGNVAVAVFILAMWSIMVAFFSASWLVSDYRISGAQFDRLGLWMHCFRSLPDPHDEYQRRFFSGCRWIFDPFTTGYHQIRGYLMPWFIVITQFFFLVAFGVVSPSFCSAIVLCFGPGQKRFLQLIRLIGFILVGAGISGGLAVIVFALFANRDGWMPGHSNNFFGWAFALAISGVIETLIAGSLFLLEANIQKKKQKYLANSQQKFELEQETKA
ncbi:transmembrane protein 182-like [Nilaparvata lugens]|uniref:transmembrane protein 182-like n=1 Tax=Nilaparvata lugens TaxID=108931 RepID=UPI00193DB6F4|nr:transmembrane protein 182-like [Nilaparvata lugens]